MKYALGHALTLGETMYNFDHLSIKTPISKIKKDVNVDRKNYFVNKVFLSFLNLVFDDIIDNNVTFCLPTNGKKSEIHLERVSGKDFKNARSHGKFKDIDFIKTGFTGYKMVLSMYGSKRCRTKEIYLQKEKKNKIIENTNNGKQYF